MHFSFIEKLGAAALIVAWLIFGANFLGDTLVSVRDYTPAFRAVAVAATTQQAAAPAAEEDFATLLAAATPEQGQKVWGKCVACHSIEKGGPNKVGPNMYNVVGGPKAHIEGFAYSSALAAMHSDVWSYENLNAFLTSPKDYVAGTKMTFAGLKNPADRAAVIVYMRSLTENPPPLPKPAPKPAQTAAADAATAIAVAAAGAAATAPAAAPAAPVADFKTLLTTADPAQGEKVFNKCKACHNANSGGANLVGPNLWNVVGAPIAKHEGFTYSAALAGKEGKWSYDNLNTYLTSPKAFAAGTKMTFAGLAKPEERAAVIAWLRTRADTPQPLP